MTRVLPRTNFHSSELIRCLNDLDIVEAVEAGNAFAEKLGLWIHFADAIGLSAVHSNGNDSMSITLPGIQHAAYAAASSEFDRIQALLANSIRNSCSLSLKKSYINLPQPMLELPLNVAAAYAPYRRFYETYQRDMELSIQPLRNNIREALAKTSPPLKKLAALDMTFEKILHDRERLLLSKVPVLLKKRFEQLFKQHQRMQADVQQPDNPKDWICVNGWLACFCNELQKLLLAELDFRLQPSLGLIEAFKQETQ